MKSTLVAEVNIVSACGYKYDVHACANCTSNTDPRTKTKALKVATWDKMFVTHVLKSKGVADGPCKNIMDYVFGGGLNKEPKAYRVMVVANKEGAVMGYWEVHVVASYKRLWMLNGKNARLIRDRWMVYDDGPMQGGWMALDEVLALLFGKSLPTLHRIGY